MRFFRRDETPTSGAGFWGWWAGARDRIANAIETGGFDGKLVNEISRAVAAIDRRLAWEFAPGTTAKHALCVSPEGNAEVRPVALHWLESAPPPDATWEYHASRQASPTLSVFSAAGRRLDLAEMRAITSWDGSRRRLDVRLWHPAFDGAPPGLPEQASLLFLDKLLGEEEVERWIGAIEALHARTSGKTPAELKAEVERQAAVSGGDTWVLGQRASADGKVAIVMADAALKRIDHPFDDKHIAIRLPIEGGGMPDGPLAELLNAEEDRLVGLLRGVATLAGRTTSPGERVIHFVAEDMDRVHPGIDAWAQGLPPWRIKVESQHDPTWSFQREMGVQ
jgi:hypothetical protein